VKKKQVIISALATISSMFGAVVVPGPGPWQTITTPATIPGTTITSSVNTNSTSSAYWNNTSTDSTTQCANIGCYMVGSSYFNGSDLSHPLGLGMSNPVYLGNNDGTAVTDFNFANAGATDPVTLIASIAGFQGSNVMGWYDSGLTPSQLTAANGPGTGAAQRWGVIETPASAIGSTTTFTPTANFGLWFLPQLPDCVGVSNCSPTTAQIVNGFTTDGDFTQSSQDTDNRAGLSQVGMQHFAVFATSAVAGGSVPADFWVGAEDSPLPHSSNSASADGDYNDMIVHLQIVPEPGYYLVLSLGLVGLGVARRRLNKA
jgi:hypothetical protein